MYGRGVATLIVSFVLAFAAHSRADTIDLLAEIQSGSLSPSSIDPRHINEIVEYERNPRTPLMLAAELGHTEIVSLLLRSGADPNVAPDGGASALLLAANKGHYDVAVLLVENGADVNHSVTWGATPLINAAANRHPTIVELLLANGARIDAEMQTPVDESGRTALMIAAASGYNEIVDLILSSGQRVSASDRNEADRLLSESQANRTFYFGEVREVGQDFIVVEVLDRVYRFPVQPQTRVFDEASTPSGLAIFRVGDAATVAVRHDQVMEIHKGTLLQIE